MKLELQIEGTTSSKTTTYPNKSFSDFEAVRASYNLIKALSSVLAAFIAIASFGSLTAMAGGCTGSNFTQPAGSPISIPGNNPRQVVVADFNGDGKPDIAVTPTSTTGGSVFLGNGNGGFGAAKPFTALGDLVVGDFNGDGKLDLATLLAPNQGSNKVTILLGDGTGSFSVASGSPFSPPSPAAFFTVGDFNLDGKLDLALLNTANPGSVTVMLGNGSGGFTATAGSPIAVGNFPNAIAVSDINLDGKPDLVVINGGSNSAAILFGNGTGAFSPAPGSPVTITPAPSGVTVGDFNLDGKPDLAVAANGGLNVTVYLGNGSGGFVKTGNSISVFAPLDLTTADFNLDGLPDLAVADASTGALILLGDGLGHFPPVVPISVGTEPESVAVGDFNLDGRPDFAMANFTSKDVSIELNGCTAGGLLQFSKATYSAQEDLSAVTITVTRTGDTSGAATVSYATVDGVAKQKSDYEMATGTLTFAPGDSSKTFQVLLNEDTFTEGDETFGLALTNAIGASIGQQGTASVKIVDDSIEPAGNSIDDAQSFVYMQYHDFLNREPDAAGLQFWTSQITACGSDQACIDGKRADVSAAFYLSIEFQNTGYLVYRTYKAAYGNLPGAPVPIHFNEFVSDTHEIGQGVVVNQPGWDQLLESNTQAFMTEFVQRPRFTSAYPTSMTPMQFVDALSTNAAITPLPSDRLAAINEFAGTPSSIDVAARARALRDMAANPNLAQQEFSNAFVLIQYFGYLRRDPNAAPDSDFSGYNFWLNKLNQFNGSYQNAQMVKAFIVSSEYRQRFGP